MTNKHWLSMIAGDNVGHRYAISKGQGTIGRDSSNAIQIIDEEVSRIHCRYQIVDDQLEVADLLSANGTFVNGKTVERCTLDDGDLVKIGSTVFKVKIEHSPPEPTSHIEYSTPGNVPRSESPSALSYLPARENPNAEGWTDEWIAGVAVNPNSMAQIAKDMSFIYRASLVASSNAAPDKMLDNLIDLIFDWVSADRCCVLLHDNDTGQFSVRASRSRYSEADQSDLVISQPVVDYVCEHRLSILTKNILEDQRLSVSDRKKRIGVRQAICVPLDGHNKFLGVIYIDGLGSTSESKTDGFNENSRKLMVAIGRQIGFAIENNRHFVQLLEQQALVNIGQTTSSLTHHMKNILQGINGGSHLVETGLESENIQTIKTGWAIVDRNQHEISKIINNMLIFSNPYEPHLCSTDLNEVISRVFNEVGPSLARRSIQYDWTPASEPAIFQLDERGIHSAIQNLISCCATACHGQSHGNIKITVDRSKDELVVIAIADNSLPAEIKNAEDPYSSAMSEPVHNMNSVELAVSRKLVRGHGGTVDLEHPESGGNLFLVQLPAK